MKTQMQRREFVTLLGASAAAWPLAAGAQQPGLPVIGILALGPPSPEAYLPAFRKGLADAGFIEGQNVSIEYRWANMRVDQLANLAVDLVQRKVDVIAALDTGITVAAAQSATSTIPIVFTLGGDPIKFGFVRSLNRPGGNMTGVTVNNTELGSKQLDLLSKMVPNVTTFGYMSDPRVPTAEEQKAEMQAAARALGHTLTVVEARSSADIDNAFAIFAERAIRGLVVAPYIVFSANARKVLALTARHRIAAMYPGSSWTAAGGLMSYSADRAWPFYQVGRQYIARILKGTKPADLPVQQPTKFEFVINLRTAKALQLDIPPTLLALADEVIE